MGKIRFRLLILLCILALGNSSCNYFVGIEKNKYSPKNDLKEFDSPDETKEILNLPQKIKVKSSTTYYSFLSTINSKSEDTLKVLTISPKVGDVIDSAEKAKYHLFSFWENDKFLSAQFVQQPDSSIFLVGTMKDGTIKKMPYTRAHYDQTAKNVFGETISPGINKDTFKILTISPLVGDTIDWSERQQYHLFPHLNSNKFSSGTFIQRNDGSIVFSAKMSKGKTKNKRISKRKYNKLANNYFEGNNDYYNARKASLYATLAIIFFLGFIVIIPLIPAAIFAAKAFTQGRMVTKQHPQKEKYKAKVKATYGVVIGITSFAIEALIVLFILAIIVGNMMN
jgi:hypothetical protein